MRKPIVQPVANKLTNTPHTTDVVLGIDPSLTSTGMSVIEHGVTYNSFVLAPKNQHAAGVNRLAWFYQSFTAAIQLICPAVVAIEGYSFGSKGQTFSLGELGGILRFALYTTRTPYLTVTPGTLKKFATGKGNAEKDTVSKELYKRFGVDLSQNDKVDATGLALFALAHTHRKSMRAMSAMRLTVPQLTALSEADTTYLAPGAFTPVT